MDATGSGIAEMSITGQPIKNIKQFLYYCIRFSTRTFRKFGNRKGKPLIKLLEDYQELTKNGINMEEMIEDKYCAQYIEDKKETKHKRLGKHKTNNLTDVILEQLDEYNIENAQEWDSKIEPEFKLQLKNSDYPLTHIYNAYYE